MNEVTQRYIAFGSLIAGWGLAIVLRHLYPDQADSIDDVIGTIKVALTGLGAFHLTVYDPSGGTAANPPKEK